MPKLYCRETIVQKADIEITAAMSKTWKKHDLTCGEMVKILSGALASVAKRMIRRERRSDETRQAG